MGGGIESRCIGCVRDADVAVRLARESHCNIRNEHTTWLSRPPPTQKLGAENHMLQLKIQSS